MSKLKKPLIDPTLQKLRLTTGDQEFIEGNRSDQAATAKSVNVTSVPKGKKAKARTVSMSDEVFDALTSFVHQYPEEGSRSSVIGRAIMSYIRSKIT
jgi:hypothetical protein